jgi:purine-nucleoside phosphorylase
VRKQLKCSSETNSAEGAIAEATGRDHFDSSVVLGSGWTEARESLDVLKTEIPYSHISGMMEPVAPGHLGVHQYRELSAKSLLVFCGRTRPYEGHGTQPVTESVRISATLGAKRLLLTNANGCYQSYWEIGTGVVITDHLNMTGVNPLSGAEFLDLQNCWDRDLNSAAIKRFPELRKGTYAFMRGPEYQTQAEGRMLRSFGADIVGMSSVLEAIMARHLNMSLFGLSVVTSKELYGTQIDPDEVVAAAAAAATKMGSVLAHIIQIDEPNT